MTITWPSHDHHMSQVISNLKKVTFGIGPQEPIDEDTLTSLDKPGRPARQDGASRIQVSTLDRVSPRQSPRGKRRHTDVGDVSRVRFERTENGEGNENGGRSDWTKSRWRRHAVIRRRVGRSGSVTSEGTDRSESPSEKMVRCSKIASRIVLIRTCINCIPFIDFTHTLQG